MARIPAPWVPYTRAGCDFGVAANANIVLENVTIDIPTVFGPDSPEAQDALALRIEGILEGATFGGQRVNSREVRELILQGRELVDEVHAIAELLDH